jgi:hypothetical protein
VLVGKTRVGLFECPGSFNVLIRQGDPFRCPLLRVRDKDRSPLQVDILLLDAKQLPWPDGYIAGQLTFPPESGPRKVLVFGPNQRRRTMSLQ